MNLKPGEYVFKCPECDSGSIQAIGEPCPVCHGEGVVDVLVASGETVGKPCHECNGVGASMVWMTCQDCHGTAKLFVDEGEAAGLISEGHKPLRTPR